MLAMQKAEGKPWEIWVSHAACTHRHVRVADRFPPSQGGRQGDRVGPILALGLDD